MYHIEIIFKIFKFSLNKPIRKIAGDNIKKELQLTIENVIRAYQLMTQIHCSKYIAVKDLASELSVKNVVLLSFMLDNAEHFATTPGKKGKTPTLVLTAAYLLATDNPNSPSYLPQRIKENKKTVKLSYYNNYGHISGYYLEPSKDLAAQYLNTIEKINYLVELLSLKPAQYFIGGMGDCATINPPGSFEISASQLNQVEEGWTVVGEFLSEDLNKSNKIHDPKKINTTKAS
jgi:hypothetical protein